MKYEENPFEDPTVAAEWINSVENEQGLIRDKEIYPLLENWVDEVKPQLLVEIGSGQGICTEHVGAGKYIGVEPSASLIDRAKEKYPAENRQFILGNAYDLPLQSESVDACFSVNVLFHLEDLDRAFLELARVLKRDGSFLIITANPDSYQIWEHFYFDSEKTGKKIVGKVNVPINHLSKNIFYQHNLTDIEEKCARNGLIIDSITSFGATEENQDDGLLIAVRGRKK